MISINGLTVAYGSFTLLDNLNFHISERDKIGLVGKNGSGKTTIMKLINGLQSPTSGSVDKPADLRIGYLPQIMEHHHGRTVMEETLTAFDSLAQIEKELNSVNEQLAERTDYESEEYLSLITRLNDLTDVMTVSQSEPAEVLAQKTLLGLGFRDEDFDRLTDTFSQGWNMRIELAKILLSEPDLLMLDEPTNHLDIESIEWLEDYLRNRKGSLLLVSHDRKFLDNVTNRTVEIMLGHIHDYRVPYSKYLQLRAERLAQQQAAYENQHKMIEKTEDFINRFRYKPTKSNQVQSRIKQLEKLERIEIDETDNVTLTVKFPPAPRAGDIIFKASDLTVGYPGKVVFSDAQVEIRRGEKVAFIGRNGEGKTTLMRVINGELEPISGEAKVGYNVSIGYYAQNQEDVLDRNLTVWETLDNIAVGDIRGKLRDILAQFLFRGEDIDKKVSVLSGGERARLGMAKFMLQPYNVLALDEPTNHMDIKSKDILKQALKAYDGTLIVVSHDRDFLEGLVDKMYEFRDGRVKEYLGSVSDFLEKRKLDSLQELERRFGSSKGTDNQEKKVAAQQSFEQKKSVSKEERRVRHRIDFLEKEIAGIEEKMAAIEAVLSNPSEKDDVLELTRSYLELKRECEGKTEEWASLMESL
ncbi:MAG: ABC-F family ATP-binding cassette domain-containing protein [Bacteroidales bacterium]|uniref:ABC-F family ATP-binding cassette domain-containing protein n=1 Tax=Candidatus Cryptobacteroides sp. TaxID=2952915 RepID=UPI002A740929|nr:ABC-F family ATP-binding cassette domain-containing protein [Candidatus Cryptobacteroides sp.]MBS7276846.1 ABC-F family ATP-binding cassette domain-containing protein [Bacteroidales bacterium]MCI6525813.1 ABC-F family ATP-binding cassette domain-containing protein [Bacteroidales bacterium]MDD5914882.1 ABC-F family ATP-binding cassette domain-containing protein [Bacteroidales bacterium]MDD6829219.1 ABC-F family ATP-binding cassette domain-containing protein [Bacteroidales bacterium]MDD713551